MKNFLQFDSDSTIMGNTIQIIVFQMFDNLTLDFDQECM